MEQKPHPTHHLAFARGLRFAAAAGLALFVANLFVLREYNKAILMTAVTIILIVTAFLIWTRRHCRSAVCPTCGLKLPRDPNGPRGQHHYPCDACQTVWVSEIRSTG